MVTAVEALKASSGPTASKGVVDLVFGDRKPAFKETVPSPLKLLNENLNQSQIDAIQFALSASDVALIHGPPGTGKTTTLIELVWQLLQRGGPKTRILCCGPSNISVGTWLSNCSSGCAEISVLLQDNVVERLYKAKVSVVRLGHPARILPSILDTTLDALIKTSDAGALVSDIQQEMDATLKSLQDGRNRSKRRELYAELKALRKELRQREVSMYPVELFIVMVILLSIKGKSVPVCARLCPSRVHNTEWRSIEQASKTQQL